MDYLCPLNFPGLEKTITTRREKMSEDYKEMWKNLGLDLEAHDALLEVLGTGYHDIYMS